MFLWRTKVWIVAAQSLMVPHSVHGNVTVVGSEVQGTGDVQNVDGSVRYVGGKRLATEA